MYMTADTFFYMYILKNDKNGKPYCVKRIPSTKVEKCKAGEEEELPWKFCPWL